MSIFYNIVLLNAATSPLFNNKGEGEKDNYQTETSPLKIKICYRTKSSKDNFPFTNNSYESECSPKLNGLIFLNKEVKTSNKSKKAERLQKQEERLNTLLEKQEKLAQARFNAIKQILRNKTPTKNLNVDSSTQIKQENQRTQQELEQNKLEHKEKSRSYPTYIYEEKFCQDQIAVITFFMKYFFDKIKLNDSCKKIAVAEYLLEVILKELRSRKKKLFELVMKTHRENIKSDLSENGFIQILNILKKNIFIYCSPADIIRTSWNKVFDQESVEDKIRTYRFLTRFFYPRRYVFTAFILSVVDYLNRQIELRM